MKKKPFILPYNEKRRLHDRAYRAQLKDQSEVCGVMSADRNSKRIVLHFLVNRSDKTGSFRLFPSDMIAMQRTLKPNKQLIGLFHSHVVSEAIPGPRDIQNAQLSHLQLIYDVCGQEVRLWRIKKDKNRKVALEVSLILESKKN